MLAFETVVAESEAYEQTAVAAASVYFELAQFEYDIHEHEISENANTNVKLDFSSCFAFAAFAANFDVTARVNCHVLVNSVENGILNNDDVENDDVEIAKIGSV